MALTFNHSDKQISVPQVDAQPLMIQDLVNAIRDEEASERGIAYDQILDASGKETLKTGVTTGITASLRSTWAISFATGSYQATIDGGNLADALDRVVNTGSPQVLVLASAAATITAADGGALAPTAEQNAIAVWAQVSGQMVVKLLRNKAVTDPATGIMTVYDDDGTTVLLQGQLYEDAAGSQTYQGRGAERRERLT